MKTRKIIINKCYGGFGFSPEVFKWLVKNKGWKAVEINDQTPSMHDEFKQFLTDNNADCYYYSRSKYQMLNGKYYENEDKHCKRTDPDLIEAVEKLGPRASGELSSLKIVQIPANIKWEIDDYDGIESVHEAHESWG